MRIFKITFLLAFMALTTLNAEKLLHPYNLNFELGVRGVTPDGWYLPLRFEKLGYSAVLNDLEAVKGQNCMQLALIGEYQDDIYGNVFQMVDAKRFAGRKVKFKVALKSELVKDSSNCSIWILSHFADGKDGKTNTLDSIESDGNWSFFEVISEIDEDADNITFGVNLRGKGVVLIDDASFDLVTEKEFNINESTDKISEQGIRNLTSFSKLYGYLRYFYPSVDLQEIDWDRFVLTGMEYFEEIESTDILFDSLKSFFKPIAPALHFKPTTKIDKPKNAVDNVSVAWMHIGAPLGINITYFSNRLHNIYVPTRQREAPVIQIINTKEFKGKEVEFSVWAKADLVEPAGQGQIWIGIDDKANRSVDMTTNAENPIKSKEWTKYSIRKTIPETAEIIRVGLVMLGDGELYFDEPKLKVHNSKNNYIKNEGFEDNNPGSVINSWNFPESAFRAGYKAEVINENSYKEKKCLKIESNKESTIKLAKENEILQDEILKDRIIQMPLTLYADMNSTIPSVDLSNFSYQHPRDFIFEAKDRSSRLALVTILWNIQRHFALNVDNEIDWDLVLAETFKEVSALDNESEFIDALNRMLTKINDGQARAWIAEDEIFYGLPVLWKVVDNKLLVTKSSEEENPIFLGSQVLEIDGINPMKLISEKKKLITGNNDNWKNLRASAELRSGRFDDKPVKIKFVNPGGEIDERELAYNVPIDELSDNRPPKFSIIDNGFFYLDLTRISDRGLKNIVKDMKEKFKESKLMIFDLRGYCNITDEFLGMFINSELTSFSREIPVFVRPNESPGTFLKISGILKPMNPEIKGNIVFLIDERTSGSAELVAAVAKHYKLAILIGTTTSGTSDEVLGINLPGKYNASMVGMKADFESNELNFRDGIKPDIEIKPSIEGISLGKDEILESVYELFK